MSNSNNSDRAQISFDKVRGCSKKIEFEGETYWRIEGDMLLDEEGPHLAGLSDFIGKPISLQAESAMGQEQYDILLL